MSFIVCYVYIFYSRNRVGGAEVMHKHDITIYTCVFDMQLDALNLAVAVTSATARLLTVTIYQ